MVAVTMKLAWLLLGGALLLSGCSEDDHPAALAPVPLPECPDESYSLCDVRVASCQEQLRSLAACVYGSDDPPDVPVHVVSEAQFRALLEDSAAQDAAERTPQDAQARDAMESALVALRLVEPGALSDSASIDNIIRLFVGVYLDAEQGIVLIDRGRPQSSADADMLLLHEYIHALQDADYDLETWLEPHLETTDALLAARSVTEGEATFYQLRAGAALLGHDVTRVDFEATFDNLRGDLVDSARRDASPYVASSATFPYGYGATLANRLWQDGGQGFESELFANVPPTTREVMRRAVYPNDPAYSEREPLEHTPPTDTGEYELLDQDVLGTWLAKLVLQGSQESFDEVWLGVFSDQLWVYADAAGNTAWLWEVETNDPDAMPLLVADLRQRLASTVQIETDYGRVYFAGGSDGAPQFLLDAGQAFLDAGEL